MEKSIGLFLFKNLTVKKMKRTILNSISQCMPASLTDTITTISIFLKIRDKFPNAIILESSDYHISKDSMTYICFDVISDIEINNSIANISYTDKTTETLRVSETNKVENILFNYINSFKTDKQSKIPEGLYGYISYDSIKYFEDIQINAKVTDETNIPEIKYSLYRYTISIDNFNKNVKINELIPEGDKSNLKNIIEILRDKRIPTYGFSANNNELDYTDKETFKALVKKGKKACKRGDVFQLVLSRRFSQEFTGDEFNIYRALRNINPSPYLFFFDYGNFKILGSSPESHIKIDNSKVYINPIAGTFKRTGDDNKDRLLAEQLATDPKENAEHIMLVDLARNDISKVAKNVNVDVLKEVQFYSHVIHLVSTVSGDLPIGTNSINVMAGTFPAGTLTGAPKYKAMQIIDENESHHRSFYGGAIGFLGFNGDINHAIMIRSILSKNNKIIYQAGAGIVIDSNEENEFQETNNKINAIRKAIEIAENF